MKAWISRRYGGPEVLELVEQPVPAPGADDVLIRIHATTVSSADVRLRRFNMPRGFGLIGRLALGITRLRQPVLGSDFAGTVAATGKRVTAFKPGDAVIGFAGAAMGCHAQYCVMSTRKPLVLKPASLTFGEAASLPFGGMTALHFLRKVQLRAGETVLVTGASGAVGSAFVQLARHAGAAVTGVTSSRNLDLVRSLGAARVIDYTREDFTNMDDTWDVIVDTVAASSFRACVPRLKPHGRYVSVSGDLSELLARRAGTKKTFGGPAAERPEDLGELVSLAQRGILKPVIDRTCAFEELPQAHAYVETGRKRGSVVVSGFL